MAVEAGEEVPSLAGLDDSDLRSLLVAVRTKRAEARAARRADLDARASVRAKATEAKREAARRLLPLAPGHTRGDCGDARPCPWTCRHRLDDGACVLDLANEGGMTLDATAKRFGLTRERVRQIERVALARLRLRIAALGHDAVELHLAEPAE